jgi:4-aminobutyrate aminotransferase-like enzyme/Ser/Thr protein kinase RdoA (MazF antagonist)
MVFDHSEIHALVLREYGFEASMNALAGYDEQNVRLTDAAGKHFLLKIAPEGAGLPFLEAQIAILQHLAQTAMAPHFQQCIQSRAGAFIVKVERDGQVYYMRLFTFIEGHFWVDQSIRSHRLQMELGSFIGNMDKLLANFSHPAMHRNYTWDISTALDNLHELHAIRDPERKRIAGYFLLQFQTEVMPVLSTLRHAYVHNDANDYNVLVDGDRIIGLIDFGDMVHTALINNLAVACTYAMLGEEEPLTVAACVVKGYHGCNPLLREEVDLLYYLIAGRLCISVIQSAIQSSSQSDNEHHFITEKNAWKLLAKMIRINPLLAKDAFRMAAGFDPAILPDDHGDLLRERERLIGKNLSISYRTKLKIVQGALQYLYDDRGRTYVDCVNNPSHVGHCHPVVVRRMQRQLATLNTNTRYLSDLIVQYADRIIRTLPDRLQVCYFVNSGSEANDLAIRMSRCYTGQEDVIVLDHAYHGNSTLAIDISPYKFESKGGTGQRPWVHKAMNPDTYRGPYSGREDAGIAYASDVERIITFLRKYDKKPAAFICETLLGVGGQMPLPDGYLKSVYEHVHKAGGVCIADEVQVGFGRVGSAFWGFQLQEVEPDIVVLGKPIGNGHPMGAVVVTRAIADAFNNGLEYFNTFGGNPVSMATGLAVLDVIEQEGMQQHAREVGEHLMKTLRQLMMHHPIIGDVRGQGLFIGVELVRDRQTKEPAVPEIDVIVEEMKERGFLLSTDGPLHNVLKIKPPMPFNMTDADALCYHLQEVLGSVKLDSAN